MDIARYEVEGLQSAAEIIYDTYKKGDISAGLRGQYLEHGVAEKITGVSNSDTTIRHSNALKK